MNQNSKQLLYTGLAGIAAVVLYLLPLLIYQENAYVLIHDHLDGQIQFANIYRTLYPIFFDAQFSQILNGSLPPASGIDLNFANHPYFFFQPFTAYLLIQFMSRLVAFFGMFLLIKALINNEQEMFLFIAVGTAVLFSALPHYPPRAYVIPILPWLAWSFIAIIQSKDRSCHWAVLTIAPFYSSLLHAPIFLLALFGIWWLKEALIKKTIHYRLLFALIFTSVIYIITSHQLLISLLNDSGYQSMRAERIMESGWKSLSGSAISSAANFVVGQYHVFSLHEFILVISGFAVFLHIRSRSSITKEIRSLLGLLALCGAISLWVGFYYWAPVAGWRASSWSVLNMIGWDRIHWLHPMLWYIVLTYALTIIINCSKNGRFIVYCLLMLQGLYVFSNSDYLNEKRSNGITFRQFFAEEQFSEIHRFINRDPSSYRVVSVGIHPSISIYNGFYALDGYSTDYDISHKNSFRTIIAPELAKNPTLNRYFATYGLRAYIFSSELGKYALYTKWKNRSIERLDLNLEAFMSLNGQYILSAVEIKQAEDCGLQLLQIFDSPNSAWRIHLYQPAITSKNTNIKNSSAFSR